MLRKSRKNSTTIAFYKQRMLLHVLRFKSKNCILFHEKIFEHLVIRERWLQSSIDRWCLKPSTTDLSFCWQEWKMYGVLKTVVGIFGLIDTSIFILAIIRPVNLAYLTWIIRITFQVLSGCYIRAISPESYVY